MKQTALNIQNGKEEVEITFVYKVGNKTLEEMLGDIVMEQKMQ